MAKTSDEVKAVKKPKFTSRIQRRCWRCGRRRGYFRRYRICRICFRELATKGEMTGFTKASW